MEAEIVEKFNQKLGAIERGVQGIREFLELAQCGQNIAASIEMQIKGIKIAVEQLLPLCEEVAKDHRITAETTIPGAGEKTTAAAVESKGPVEASLSTASKEDPENR